MDEEHALGIDLGATNVRAGIGDRKGRLLKKLVAKTDKQHGCEGIPLQIVRMIRRLLKEHESPIRGIGIGSIGPLDLEKGTITRSPNIPFQTIPLLEILNRELDGPIVLLNDGSAAAISEKTFGAGRGVDNLAYVTLSTGVGGGVYVDGRLLRGKDGNASEIGHMVIDYEGRLECGCGGKGHWEAYCSAQNIPHYVRLVLRNKGGENSALLQRGDPSTITTKMLCAAAKAGDELALRIMNSIGKLNAAGFANIINAFDPSIITVGGALALKHEELILEPIRKYVPDYAINRVPDIIKTPLGEDAVLLGAMAEVYQQ